MSRDADSVSSFHAGGANLVFGDGAAHFVKGTVNCRPIDPVRRYPGQSYSGTDGFVNLPPNGVWQALTTRAGGEPVTPGDG